MKRHSRPFVAVEGQDVARRSALTASSPVTYTDSSQTLSIGHNDYENINACKVIDKYLKPYSLSLGYYRYRHARRIYIVSISSRFMMNLATKSGGKKCKSIWGRQGIQMNPLLI